MSLKWWTLYLKDRNIHAVLETPFSDTILYVWFLLVQISATLGFFHVCNLESFAQMPCLWLVANTNFRYKIYTDPSVAWSKALVFGCWFGGFEGSNPAEDIDACVL